MKRLNLIVPLGLAIVAIAVSLMLGRYGAYLAHVTWEPAARLEERAARLLPGLLLARVDGKSPVEYVTDEADKNRERRVARALGRSGGISRHQGRYRGGRY